jgi:hypothetical protein
LFNNLGTVDGERLVAEKKSQLFQIQMKLFKNPEVSFTVDQLALIKERAGIICAPLVYGRICEFIDAEGEVSEEGEEENGS